MNGNDVPLLLTNGRLLTMEQPEFLGDILIENGVITRIGTDLDCPGAERVDLGKRHATPGLVDAHCHTGLLLSGSRENDHNENSNPITPEMRAIDGINPQDAAFFEARSGGVTTCVTGPGSINLIGGVFAAVKPYGNAVEDMLLRAPVAMKMALGENPKFNYTAQNRAPKSRMGEAALIRQTLVKAAEYADGPGKPRDLGLEALARVIRREIPLKIHCHRADDIMTAIRIAEEFGVRYTLDHCTEGYRIPEHLLSALSRNCEGIIIGPLLCFKRKSETANAVGLRLPKLLYDAGIPFAIMTDFYELPQEQLLLFAALAAANGLPEEEALRSVTVNAAKIAGVFDRVGSLAPGKDGDIAVFDKRPLDAGALCQMTVINGRIVFDRAQQKELVQ